ncbi:hypothetical protein ACQP2F_43195 [Actinoplanes sp. CA-030573]|uniref:hypothetical protein n=1 Tax=Actinoplanes sp. CA-030573 TaxID=3239898 RepID=UPI003D8C6668
MYRDRFRIGPALALGLGVVLVIGGCLDPGDAEDVDSPAVAGGWSTAGCAVPRIPEHVTVGGARVPVTPPKLDAVMSRIDQAGRAEFRDSFAGLEVDQEHVLAIVYRVPSTPFDDFIRKTAEDMCVQVRDAVHSTAELAVWHDRVLADLPYWNHEGVGIVSVGARHDGSGIEIGVRDVGRARPALVARYGARAPLIIVSADPVRPLPAETSRVAPPPGI